MQKRCITGGEFIGEAPDLRRNEANRSDCTGGWPPPNISREFLQGGWRPNRSIGLVVAIGERALIMLTERMGLRELAVAGLLGKLPHVSSENSRCKRGNRKFL